jgi:CPA1 family monovalent cation:H+ antiporter
VVFALNIFTLFIGLQIARSSWAGAPAGSVPAGRSCRLATVIAVRIVWHMSFNATIAGVTAAAAVRPGPCWPTVGSGLIDLWAGMRGITGRVADPRAFRLAT